MFEGNVPSSLFATGALETMEEHYKNLIERCAPDEGCYIAPGVAIDNAYPSRTLPLA
jgi:hypothetical protein